jgi:tetratricopeptide (TPR) repeat protein
MHAHGASFGATWEPAYSALTGLYYRDTSATTEAAFHQTLGDEQNIGQRLKAGPSAAASAVTGGTWFYYGMRYGVYRTLAVQKDWPQHDPEDFLAAGLERNPDAAVNYVELARAYADAGETDAALTEYHHALELAPDSPSLYDGIAVLLWHAHRNDEAIANWRQALMALNRVQNNGPAPESFWTGFTLIAQHIGEYKLSVQLHPELDNVLRTYIGFSR